MYEGPDRRNNGSTVERVAVQEAIQERLEKNVEGLHGAIADLTKQISAFASTCAVCTEMHNNQQILISARIKVIEGLPKRVDTLERAIGNTKSFIAGVGAAAGVLGGLVVGSIELIVKMAQHA